MAQKALESSHPNIRSSSLLSEAFPSTQAFKYPCHLCVPPRSSASFFQDLFPSRYAQNLSCVKQTRFINSEVHCGAASLHLPLPLPSWSTLSQTSDLISPLKLVLLSPWWILAAGSYTSPSPSYLLWFLWKHPDHSLFLKTFYLLASVTSISFAFSSQFPSPVTHSPVNGISSFYQFPKHWWRSGVRPLALWPRFYWASTICQSLCWNTFHELSLILITALKRLIFFPPRCK